MTERPRIFAIAHSSVVADYRSRHHELARRGEFEVTLLVPDEWQQFNHPCRTVPGPGDETIELLVRRPRTWGLRHHGLRNVSHVYPDITGLIADRRPHLLELWEEPYSACAWTALRAFRSVNPTGPVACFSAQNVPRWLPPPFSWFRRALFRSMSLLLAMNDDVVKVAARSGWTGRSLVLPLGVSPERFAPDLGAGDSLVATLGLRRPVVGFLGKMTAQKGIEVLLEAMKGIPEATRGSLLMIGSGELQQSVDERVQSLGRPARRLDAIPHDEVPRYLAAMDVVVAPSITVGHLKEQFGRVVIEAMAAGRAVVVSDSGELPNVVGDGGVVVPEGDPCALRGVLADLMIGGAKRGRLGERARIRCREHFTWSVIADETARVYSELLAGEGLTKRTQ